MENTDISLSEWLLTIVITSIPIVNIIMLCIWAFGGNNISLSKKNWARAMLIIGSISILLAFISVLLCTSMFIFLI